ncbi:MAG: TonB-dependent receptor, partial [Blastocatellia bacterium]
MKTPINGAVYTAGQLGITGVPAGLPAFGQVFYSVPTDLGAGNPQNTYSTNNRIDWNISNNTQLYGRYALTNSTLFPGTVNTSPWVGFDTGQTTFDQNYQVNLTHTFSSRFVSQSKLVYNRLNLQQPLGAAPAGPTLYLNPSTTGVIQGFPVALPGYSEFTPGNAIPFGGPQNLLQGYEDISYLRGNHQFRIGGQFLYVQDNRAFGAYEEAVEALGTSNSSASLNNLVAGQLKSFQAAVFPQGKFPGATLTLPVSAPNFTRSNIYK